eukprot:GEMP01023219.1.p1 GENE.GEMP01023219.1~~GEMP01023219.1.p1  ORF type:complete len:603 (+),score=142.99 GEMP01023219.1:47-1855(+)
MVRPLVVVTVHRGSYPAISPFALLHSLFTRKPAPPPAPPRVKRKSASHVSHGLPLTRRRGASSLGRGTWVQRRTLYEDTLAFKLYGPKPQALVLHPSAKPLEEAVWDAEEALGLCRSVKWDLVQGPRRPLLGWDHESFTSAAGRQVVPSRPDLSHLGLHLDNGDESDEEYDCDEAMWQNSQVRHIWANSCVIKVIRKHAQHLFGTGQIEKITEHIKQVRPRIVFVNDILTPVQQQSLEQTWNAALTQERRAVGYREYDGPTTISVVDRYRVILEIFTTRAKSRYARLQVESAKLNYIRTRLTPGTPEYARVVLDVLTEMGRTIAKSSDRIIISGEADPEKERKLLSVTARRIQKELLAVRESKGQQRQQRKRSGVWTVGLVGYTNAGKTELMNAMVGKEAGKARDLLFQTLDTTLRQISLPSGRYAVIADSVGFISNLPPFLIEAFQTTLEELLECDILLHIRDIAHPRTEEQKEVVLKTLNEAGAGEKRIIEVWNKVDLLSSEQCEQLFGQPFDSIPICAKDGTNIDLLLQTIEGHLFSQNDATPVSLPFDPRRSSEVHRWLNKNKLQGTIVMCPDDDALLSVEVVAKMEEIAQFSKLFSK